MIQKGTYKISYPKPEVKVPPWYDAVEDLGESYLGNPCQHPPEFAKDGICCLCGMKLLLKEPKN